jgi:hypothetical protein
MGLRINEAKTVMGLLWFESGARVPFECATTAEGTLELVPAGKKVREAWLRSHFEQVNARLAGKPETTPSAQLLREEERY